MKKQNQEGRYLLSVDHFTSSPPVVLVATLSICGVGGFVVVFSDPISIDISSFLPLIRKLNFYSTAKVKFTDVVGKTKQRNKSHPINKMERQNHSSCTKQENRLRQQVPADETNTFLVFVLGAEPKSTTPISPDAGTTNVLDIPSYATVPVSFESLATGHCSHSSDSRNAMTTFPSVEG